MAAFNFPNSPSTNDLHTENNVTWKWNGTVWKRINNSYLTASTLDITGISTLTSGINVGTAGTISSVGNLTFDKPGAGIITATKYYGDGSNLSNITSTTINNNANNKVITGSGSANTLEAEASLTFDAGLLKIDDLGGTAGKGRLEFGNSGEQYIEGYDTGNAGSGSYLTIGSNTDERVRITSTGLFGIGITPTARLHVNGLSSDTAIILARAADSNGNAIINILSEGTSGSSRIVFSDTAAATGDAWISYSHNDRALLFSTAGVGNERLRINSSGNIKVPDNAKIELGGAQSGSGDLQIYHDGSNSIINDAGTGSLRIAHGGSNHWEFGDGFLKGNDGREIILGDSSDLKIFHDGSHSRINATDGGNGRLIISGRDGSANAIGLQLNAEDSKEAIFCRVDGSVDLFHNASKKFETTSSGVSVTGALNAAGATFGDYNVETNRTSGSSKGFYAKRGGVTCSVLSNHGTGPEGKMELYNNGTMNYSAHGTAGTLALNGYIRFGISNGAGNQLDDYEEGSWTPTLYAWGGSQNQSYDTQTGNYIKIGRQVFANFVIDLSSKGTVSGNYTFIGGLPFNHAGTCAGTMVTWGWAMGSNIGWIAGDISSTATVAWVTYHDNNNNNTGYLPSSFLYDNSQIKGTLIYRAA